MHVFTLCICAADLAKPIVNQVHVHTRLTDEELFNAQEQADDRYISLDFEETTDATDVNAKMQYQGQW